MKTKQQMYHRDNVNISNINTNKVKMDNTTIYNKKHLNTLIQNSPAGLGIIDRKGKILFASPSSEKILGYKPEELVGSVVFDLLDAKDREDIKKELVELIKKPKSTATVNCRVRHKDGSFVWLEATGTNLLNDLSVKGVVINYQDITDKIITENKRNLLDESMTALISELDYRVALHKLAELTVPQIADLCIIDTITDDEYVNRVVVKHKDADKNQEVQKLKSIPRYPVSTSKLCTSKALTEGKSVSCDIFEENNKNCGKEVHDPAQLEALQAMGIKTLTVIPIKSRGSVLGAILFGSTKEGKSLNNKIDIGFAEELAHRTGIALENAKLYRQVQNSNKLKDEFLAALAHELRNPLAPIIHSLELLRMEIGKKDSINEKELNADIGAIDKNVQNMCRLLDDLMDVSRITKGRVKLQKDVADVVKTVKRSIETSLPAIRDKDHKLHVDLAPDPLYLEADHLRLEQVFVNLLNNAAKYTPEGGNIWISCRQEDDDVVVSVKDDGKGLTPAALSRVFNLFSQENKGLERSEQEGLGIGLKLVEAYTEMHGGSTSVSSDGPGLGSEFVVRFPVRKEDDTHPSQHKEQDFYSKHDRRNTEELPQEPEALQNDEQEEDDNKAPSQEDKILVVDDNEDAVKSLSKLLEKLGYNVETAFGGAEALDIVKSAPPKLMLLDIGLPEMDGYAVARKIREITKDSDTHITLAALTGYGQNEDKILAKKAGFDYHITKPVSISELQSVLKKELG